MPSVLLVLFPIVALELLIGTQWILTGRPDVVLSAILALIVLESTIFPLPSISLGVTIYPQDLLFGPLALAAILRIMQLKGLKWKALLALSIYLLMMGSFVRGIASYGLLTPGVDVRHSFYFFTALLYFSTFPRSPRFLSTMIRQWLICCQVLAGIAIFYWLSLSFSLPFHSAWGKLSAASGSSELRVLPASAALVLVIGLLISVDLNIRRTGQRWQRASVVVFLPVIVILQHRTTWIVACIGLIWLVATSGRLNTEMVLKSGSVLVVSAISLLLLTRKSHELLESLRESSSNAGTFSWRIAGWQSLIDEQAAHGLGAKLIGRPFGAGYVRTIDGTLVTASPHSFYISTYARLGLAGAAFLLLILLTALHAAFANRPSSSSYITPSQHFWQAVLLVQLTYSITYFMGYEQGALLGILLGFGAFSANISAPHNVAPSAPWQLQMSPSHRVDGQPPIG